MSHEITATDNVVLRQARAWHGLGTIIQDDLSAVDAARGYGLTWPVEEWTLVARGPNGEELPVDTHKANVRVDAAHDLRHLLGVVGADYRVCQNVELAEFTDALAQTGRVVIESCGSLRGGKQVWFLARGESFKIGGADEVYPYVLCSNGHDGYSSIRVTPTTVRVVCANTFHMVVPRQGDALGKAAISIRHTGALKDKLEAARGAIRHYEEITRRNAELFETLAAVQVDNDQLMDTYANFYARNWVLPTNAELHNPDARIRGLAQAREQRMRQGAADFMARYRREQEALGMGPSAWMAFNALTGWVQHDRKRPGNTDDERASRKLESNLFGLDAERTHQLFGEFATLAV